MAKQGPKKTAAKKRPDKTPSLGERTKEQSPSGVTAQLQELRGFGVTPAGSFEVYRRMRDNPTIALARLAATAPIRASAWAVDTSDDVADGVKELVEAEMQRLWPDLIRHLLLALDYGFAAFEKVWEVRERRYYYRKLKPLSPDGTKYRINKADGGFAGIEQKGVQLQPEKSLWFAYDDEPGRPYGRPRHENIREYAWHPWCELSKKRGQYATKVAGVIPIIEYPEGESLDASGATKSNFELAKAVLNSLGKGNGVAMPNTLSKYAEDLVRSGSDVSQLRAWLISFLEPRGQHGEDLTGMMRHLESLMLRGWLVPERAVVEGQFGTKAEAGAHANFALLASDLLLQDILLTVNRYVVNPFLRYNWGPQAEDTVWLTRAGLDPDQRNFFRSLIEKALADPRNLDVFLTLINTDALLDSMDVPKAEETAVVPSQERNEREDGPGGPGAPEGEQDQESAEPGASLTRRMRTLLSHLLPGRLSGTQAGKHG